MELSKTYIGMRLKVFSLDDTSKIVSIKHHKPFLGAIGKVVRFDKTYKAVRLIFHEETEALWFSINDVDILKKEIIKPVKFDINNLNV